MTRKICAARVQGAAHRRAGTPCEDCWKCQEIGESTVILAVADGHGSSSCPYSRSGAQIAVNTFCAVMSGLLENFPDNGELLMTYLNREGEVRVAQAIDREWKRRVWKTHTDNKREKPVGEDGKPDRGAVYALYGTTILGLLITPQFLFAFQIGDGDILCIRGGEVRPVIRAEKFLGTQTHSLCRENAWKKALTVMRRRDPQRETPGLLLMSTDGFANSYPSGEAFEEACRSYGETIREHGFEAVADSLPGWLEETSAQGCGDDITVVLDYGYGPEEDKRIDSGAASS